MSAVWEWAFSCIGIPSEGKAECVKDLPAMEGPLQDWKPGLYYGVDDQCRIAFGSSARACSFTNPDLVRHHRGTTRNSPSFELVNTVFLFHQPACRFLSCHINPDDDSSCKRLLVPLLDGTECAPNQVLTAPQALIYPESHYFQSMRFTRCRPLF